MAFQVGQTLVTGRNVGISVDNMNGVPFDEVVEYPKGVAFEILNTIKNDDGVSYEIEFWQDADVKVNGENVTYEFDEETIQSFLESEQDEE